MSYTTITFLLFVAATGIVYFLVPKKLQWSVLLLASLFFYGLTCGIRVVFLFAGAAVIYFAGLCVGRLNDIFAEKKKALERSERKILKGKINKKKKFVIAVSCALMLLMLFSTKYCNFFGSIINDFGSIFGHGGIIPVFEILMPLGISYYTLMGISYVVDVYRGETGAEKNPFMLLLFLCYFPHIVEGPFDRYDKLCGQFRKPHYLDFNRIKTGGVRMVWGLFKKFVIADRAGLIVNAVFENSQDYSGSVLFFAVVLYTFQIYAEFSGCMDMVCGISEMFGVNIAENFKRPFFAVSINDFWRRWHITLGLWLKDYVFYPVSLSGHFRKLNERVRVRIKSDYLVSFLPSAYALFFVWFSNGMWHGASGKYIFYGLYYYLLMMLGRMLNPVSDKVLERLGISREGSRYHIFEILRTCIIVCFGMLIFRAETLGKAWDMFVLMLTHPGLDQLFSSSMLFSGVCNWDYVILGICFALIFVTSFLQEKGWDLRARIGGQSLPVRWLIYMALLFAVIIFGVYGGAYTNASFIYGEF